MDAAGAKPSWAVESVRNRLDAIGPQLSGAWEIRDASEITMKAAEKAIPSGFSLMFSATACRSTSGSTRWIGAATSCAP
ncbi:hypothetical protein [Nonomuraea dietziae]|uniref:hypothetical protein n=1 Tax=Nonomuraea dietziae TaxID=65515 RepID=UPI003410E230